MGNLTRLRSGLICDPFLGRVFEIEYTSCLAVIPASPSARLESVLEPMTPGISGQALQAELPFCDPESASLRTLKDTLALDLERSSRTWSALVTRRRGEYSARLNAARRTNGNECSSWPSLVASEVRQGFQDRSRGMKGSQESLTTVVIKCGQPAPDKHSTHGSRPESWATPRANKTTDENLETWAARQAKGDVATMPLTAQVKAWATPRCSMAQDKQTDSGKHRLGEQVQHNTNGKLNPRWVEALMGLPVGWIMPSCQSPVTTAQTNFDCSAME